MEMLEISAVMAPAGGQRQPDALGFSNTYSLQLQPKPLPFAWNIPVWGVWTNYTSADNWIRILK